MSAKPLTDLAARLMVVSDLYASSHRIDRSGDWPVLKLAEEVGELTQAWLRLDGRARRETNSDLRADLADEAADVVATILLFALREGIDLDAALEAKWFAHLNGPHSA